MDEPIQRAKEPDGDGATQRQFGWGPPPTRTTATTTSGFGATSLAAAPPPPAAPTHLPPVAPTPPPPAQRQDAAGQPPPPWHDAANSSPSGLPPGHNRTKTARQTPSIPFGVMAAAMAGAFTFNLGLQSRLDSVAILIAVAIVGAMLVASPKGKRLAVIVPVLLAIAAAAVTVLRASPWVTIPAIATWGSCLIVASGGRLFAGTGLTSTFVSYLASLGEGALVSFRSFSGIGARGTSGSSPGHKATNRTQIWRGLIAAAVFIVPMAWLLASADAAFGQLLSGLFQGNLVLHLVVTLIVLPTVVAVAITSRRNPTTGSISTTPSGPMGTMLEGTIVLAAVAGLLGVWGATQIVVALGGAERLLDTANLTAADNARQGFFQLVGVTALLVLVVLAVDRFVTRSGEVEHRRFLMLTSIIGVETVGVIIASYSRLALYIDRFGNTVLRTWVAWFLAWLAVVMAMLIIAVNHKRLRFQSIVGPVFLLAGLWAVSFGVFNPEAYVARGNLERTNPALELDVRYLTSDLGPDAIPTLVEYLPALQADDAARLTERLCETEFEATEFAPFGWNRSTATANQQLATIDCGF